MKLSEITPDHAALCMDLARKAGADCQQALMATVDLAMMAGGPSAATSVILHVAGRQVTSLATCLDVARHIEQGTRPVEGSTIPSDDYLFCCLYLATGFEHAGETASIPRIAADRFRKLTGREPNLPLSWTVAVAPEDVKS